MATPYPQRKAFTLLEVLLVVALIAILASIVIIAINPSKQIADTNNAQRSVDVNTILNGVYQYAIDNDGTLPASITTTPTDICITDANSCTGLIDLSVLTDNGLYLVAIPTDPTGASGNSAGYQIEETDDGRITVSAPDAENGDTIQVTR